MFVHDHSAEAIGIHLVDDEGFDAWRPSQPSATHTWLSTCLFRPERGKVAENRIESPVSECCHVFSDDESWSQNANGLEVVFPETRTLPRNASSFSSIADVLAVESSREHVDAWNCCKIERRNIIINLGIGPMLSEDGLGVFVILDKPAGPESSCSFEAEFDPSDAAE